MIGVVVLANDQSGNIDPAIWETVQGRSILEHTVYSVLRAELVQKVVVCAPVSQRRQITGGGIFTPSLRADLRAHDRGATTYFYENTLDPLDGLYYAALKSEIDQIIVIHANCPLIEPWLINAFARRMSSTLHTHFHNFSYNPGFRLSAFTFSMLADAFIYSEDRTQPNSYIESLGFTVALPLEPDEDMQIDNPPLDLRFLNAEGQLNQFDFLLNELNKGAEINDLIGDLYDQPKETKK